MAHYLKTEEAAAVLRVHPGTLANWRWLGRGPSFYKLDGGKVLYARADLQRYLTGARR